MPDITMCDGGSGNRECPMKDNCYRYTATPSEFNQSYFAVAPWYVDVSVSSQRVFELCDENIWVESL